jgi:YYY domain-containing protein
MPRRGGWGTWVGIALLLLAAAPFRFIGIDWDSSQHLHPDERFITMVATGIDLPSGVAEYFDTAKSRLNPYNRNFGSYIYGTLPLFGIRGLAEGIQSVARALPNPPHPALADLWPHLRDAAGYGNINLLGRVLSGVADLLTLFVVFLTGRRLGGPALGFAAAGLGALAVLQIQAAHFFTAESPLVLFCTVAFYLAVRVADTNAWRDWILLGIACALALTTKLTAGLLVTVVLAAAWLAWQRARSNGSQQPTAEVFAGLVVAGASGLLTFRIAQPYAFIGPGFLDMLPNPRYLADLANWQQIASGQVDYPPSHQWTGSTPYLWQLKNMTLWGMGPPYALAAWAGFGLAALFFARDRTRYRLWLPALLWVGLNFLYWGPQFAKPMRYLLPIYPQLALFAAFGLVTLWAWAQRRGARPWAGAAATVASVLVVGWTAFYAAAFTGIYTRPTTRVEASLWMYEQVPPGAKIAWEHWDDPLPLNLPGHPSNVFTGIELPLYGEDIPEKREQLVTKLNDADYIVLSSNRLYGSIPKLPLRYPMTVRYYQALFSGELGFTRVAEFTSRPSLLGLELNDDTAEEIFTVYEHPKVMVFRKGAAYDPARTRAILESVSLDGVLRGLKPIQAGTGGLLLTDQERQAAATGPSWSDLFDRDSLANRLPVLGWLVTLECLGLLALPFTLRLFGGLADRGFAFAKVLTVVTLAYVPWLLASLHVAPFERPALFAAVVALVGSSFFAWWRELERLRAVLRSHWRVFAASEALFALTFGVFLAMRWVNPDLWHPAYGGEKPMDFAYLNAVIRSSWFPPYDPWLAGGYINYYYFGFVIVGALIELTGIVPWVAYNLMVPTLAALTASGVASVAYNLLRHRSFSGRSNRWALGGAGGAALFAVGAGNLHAATQVVDWLTRIGGGRVDSLLPVVGGVVGALRGLILLPVAAVQGSIPPFNFDFWAPTRVISTEAVTPITEFPFFTFLYGDLHAHMIALPITLTVVGLALQLVREPLPRWEPVPSAGARPLALHLLRYAASPAGLAIAVAGVLLGVLRMTNTWDYPTYFVVLALGLLLGAWPRRHLSPRWWLIPGVGLVVAGMVSLAASAPFAARYAQFYSGFELTSGHTLLIHYLIILGAPLLALGVYLWARMAAAWRSASATVARSALAAPVVGLVAEAGPIARSPRATSRDAGGALLAGGVVLAAAALLVLGLPVVSVALLLLVVSIPLALQPGVPVATRMALALASLAVGITAAVEVLVLKGDIGRMNTVFKFYLQTWVLLAIAGATLLTPLARRVWARRDRSGTGERVVAGIVVLGLCAGLLYPFLGAPSRLQHRFEPLGPGLDGMAYMARAHYEDNGKDLRLADDLQGINWLLDHVRGSPTVVEGTAPLYHWGGRVSIYTGLPTVIGWDWHQKQQRGDFAWMVDDRIRDVGTLYNTASTDTALKLLDRYDVRYIYVGGLERAFYAAEGLQKFDAMQSLGLQRVYQQGGVSIYEVTR